MMNWYGKSKQIPVFLIFVSLLYAGITHKGLAQHQTPVYAEHIQSGAGYIQMHAILNKMIDLDAQNAPRVDVIHKIAHKAGFRVSYDTELSQLQEVIDVELSEMSAEEALWVVLDGSGMRFSLSSNGLLAIFPYMGGVEKQKKAIQTGTLTGRVVDATTGESMPGTNVYIEATGQGTSTDSDGRFQMFDIEEGVYDVAITYISYDRLIEEVEIIGGETTEVEFALQQSRSQLDEIVVTGYGARREVPTGAISTIGSQEFEVRSVQTVDQAIQAQSPGFRMVGLSGQPGADSYIRIRGIGSINADSPPLFIVDGTRLEAGNRGSMASTNILGSLNPSDIESVDILRDAEATALYGAEGANGVVLITTKRGEAGDTQFNISSQFGVSHQTYDYNLMNGPEWTEFMQEVHGNRFEDLGRLDYGGNTYETPQEAARQYAIDTYGDPNEVNTYDWYGAMMQPGYQQRYSISALGGSEKTQFYMSGGYNDQEGTFIRSRFNRASLRANIDHQATEKLRMEFNANFGRSKAFGIYEQDGNVGGTNSYSSPFHGGVTTPVTTPIYNEDGSWNQDIPGNSYNYNNVQLLDEEERTSRTIEIIGNFSTVYNISDNLGFRSRIGLNFKTIRDYRYRNPSIDAYAENGGYVEEHTRENTSWNTDHVLDYLNSFDEVHNVNTILGVEYHQAYRDNFYARGRSLPNAHYFKTIDATSINNSMGGTFSEYKKAGVFSRATYNYDTRYFATANLRYDGSSRFGSAKRWGLFYSGSLAWDLAGESFMEGAGFIEELKPRVSYGITGNSSIGNYAALNTFTTGAGAYGGGTPLRPGQLGNSNLTWETARSTDIGFDYSMFKGRAYGHIDFYRKDNENLLLNRNLPTNSGYGSIADNVGKVRFEGVELEVGAVIIESGNFSWSADFNLTYEQSEVLELAEGQDNIGNYIRVGESRRIRWGRNFAGVNPADGRPMWFDKDGNVTYTIVDEDLDVIGSQLPDYYGGLSTQLNYGHLSLNVLFHYEYGKDIRNYTSQVFMMKPHRGPRTLSRDMYARWQQPGDIVEVPRAYSEDTFPGSSTYNALGSNDMEDGSFIRLKNVILRYQLPIIVTEFLNLRGGSVFIQGENLVTWTEFSGPDPEVIAQTQSIYPKPRTFMGGFNIDF